VTTLLLASASPARLATLRSAGIEPVVRVSGVDEDAVLATAAEHLGGPLDPADAVLALARAKADAVLATLDEDEDLPDDLLVLACDSLLELDGEPHGKPADAAEATARWRRMRGRSGLLHTGHWLVDARTGDAAGAGAGTGVVGATATTIVHFADLSDAEIDAYVATGEPLAVAGAFAIDGLGGPFVARLEGDHHTVVGLSLPVLRELLGEIGVTIPELWAPRSA
jgi:septum formation protein